MSEPPAPPPETLAQAPAAPNPFAPADLVPPSAPRERVAWYAGAMLLSCVLVTVGMQLWSRDLHTPFYYDLDALLYLPLVKTTIEHGSHWRTERLGAPGEQELYDFPVIDYLHFGILWALGQVLPDLLLVYNVYSLLTYPLTVLTAMWVLRWLKLSLPTAALGGLLYAFLPYHQERYQYHYFLAAYWWVPVSLVPALALLKGDLPFFAKRPDNTWRWNLLSRSTLWTVIVGAVTALAGAYYAFFACATYAFVGMYGWVIHGTWRAGASAALVILPVVGVGVACHIPMFQYQAKYQKNPITNRYAHEADSYGLKIAHLLLPANDHNLRPLANLRATWGTPDRPAEGECAGAFGFIGAAGLLALLGLALLPRKRLWPEGAISSLTLYLVLLGSIGAFGALFNLLVTPQIRAYNRISVYIAFLCFFAVLWWLDRFLLTRTGRRMRQARYPLLGALLLFGYFDQTPWGWNPFNPKGMEKIDLFGERYRADQRFFRRIEEAVPAGTKVFCLPYSSFPESPPVNKMPVYEHARGYVMTDTLYWSFGGIKGREADAWNKSVAFSKPDHMLSRVVARGFEGLFIDGRGYRFRGTKPKGDEPSTRVDPAATIHSLYARLVKNPAARLPEILHDDGKQVFLDLRPYRDVLRATDPVNFERLQREEAEWVAPLWLSGFHRTDPYDEGGEEFVWGPFDADLVLVNPTDRVRVYEMSFNIGVVVPGPFDINIGPPFDLSFTLDKVHDPGDPMDLRRHEQWYSKPVRLEPGRNVIHFRCRPPAYFLPLDKRNLCYFIKDFTLRER